MKKVLIISLTPVASEPRVIRQADFFLSQNYEVLVAGLRGEGALDERWKFIDLSKCWPNYSWVRNLYRMFIVLLSFLPKFASHAYWVNSVYKRILKVLGEHQTSLIICNDYFTAPLGWELNKIHKCEFIVDAHEHALTQVKSSHFFKNLKWLWVRSYVNALQKMYLPKAKLVTTVCEGIAESLEKDYSLTSKPLIIRSVPFYTPKSFNKISPGYKNIKLLYHGIIAPGRGLEEVIHALPYCKDYFLMTIRGSGDINYIKSLVHLTEKLKISSKVIFENPVPFNMIVSEGQHLEREDQGHIP